MARWLLNCWYMAGWSHEVGENGLARRIIDRPVFVYRLGDGSIAAVLDRCPHRFAPLSRGSRDGDNLVCGYHGLAFSPDEKLLYIADTGRTHGEQNPKHIRVFDVHGDKVGASREFAECTVGLFDGFRLDSDGRIWTSAGDGVHCYDPDGTLIGKIKVPEVVANVAWGGGPKRNVLYICGTTSLYAVRLMVNGAKTV